jgi:hypothetical protein
MLTKEKIIELLEKLNQALSEKGVIGELGLVGGAVMCLVYNARVATKDVDAIFEPAKIIRELARVIAENEKIPTDWLNDAAKGFINPGFSKEEVLILSSLRVWAPEPRYMLAMKCISARWDSNDKDDVIFLVKLLKLTKPKEVFDIIEGYYPKQQIPAKTSFFIEELMEEINANLEK